MARKSASTSACESTVGKRLGLVGRLSLSSHGNSSSSTSRYKKSSADKAC